MRELIQLENSESLTTHLCRNCGYCVVNDKKTECEYDEFPPVLTEKAGLYTPIEFDCIKFIKR